MCGRASKNNYEMLPGMKYNFMDHKGKVINGVWGLAGGQVYNARSEKINTLWSVLPSGLITLDSFQENGTNFGLSSVKEMIVPVLYNPWNEFALLTRDSVPFVKPYHHRMPVIIKADPDSIKEWLDKRHLIETDYSDLKIAA